MGALDVPRRALLRGAVVTGMAAVAGYVAARNSAAAGAKSATAAANGYGAAPSVGRRFAALSAVPAGGGLVVEDANVVLTRSQAGDVRGFSATCTHQGCTVSSVTDGAILCPCHGSRFDANTGAVVAGPARQPLAKVPVVVRDNAVFSA
jgi:Rieske Fe-S protein